MNLSPHYCFGTSLMACVVACGSEFGALEHMALWSVGAWALTAGIFSDMHHEAKARAERAKAKVALLSAGITGKTQAELDAGFAEFQAKLREAKRNIEEGRV